MHVRAPLASRNHCFVGCQVKEAILLALVSREHLYVEGASGSAKTMLGEVVAEATGLTKWFYQMHRDTRTAELIGESIVTREQVDVGAMNSDADAQLSLHLQSEFSTTTNAKTDSTGAGTGKREIIRHSHERGGVLTCELAILDDISRAPVL